jgi:hypothetical protein
MRRFIMLSHMKRLIELFGPYCGDRTTLDELYRMIDDRGTWSRAHDLFDRIRRKTLEAERRGDECADCQYLFEEVCAKSIFNLTDTTVPFDEDSPDWVVPNALALARRLGIHESEVTRIVAR